MDKLIAELVKAQDNLKEIKFKVNQEEFVFYFRYLSLLEKARIEQLSVKITTTIKADGTRVEEYKKEDHLIPIYTILEKALDSDGKRLFSHTNPKHFKAICDLPAGLSSQIAYEMTIDIFGNMKAVEDE